MAPTPRSSVPTPTKKGAPVSRTGIPVEKPPVTWHQIKGVPKPSKPY